MVLPRLLTTEKHIPCQTYPTPLYSIVFIGTINSGIRQFLASMGPAIDGHDCVIGCSRNFTLETVLSLFSKPTAIYSNDVSLYSCLTSAYLTGEDSPILISDESLTWLKSWMGSSLSMLVLVMVFIDTSFQVKKNSLPSVRVSHTLKVNLRGVVYNN